MKEMALSVSFYRFMHDQWILWMPSFPHPLFVKICGQVDPKEGRRFVGAVKADLEARVG